MSAAVQSAARHAASGGSGIPEEGFVHDDEGKVVYSDEVTGSFVDAERTEVTDKFMGLRGQDDQGNKLYRAGKDIVPIHDDRGPRTDAYALSMTEGDLIRARDASGFGDSVVAVETPDGNHVIYVHIEKLEEGVKKGLKVTVGQKLGIIGNEGMGYPRDSTKGIHLHLEIRKGKVGLRKKRRGIR